MYLLSCDRLCMKKVCATLSFHTSCSEQYSAELRKMRST